MKKYQASSGRTSIASALLGRMAALAGNRNRRPDGTRIVGLVNIDPIRDADGRIVGAINAFHYITAWKEAEQLLQEQKHSLETLLEMLPVGVFIAHDPECRRISGNRAATQLLRMPRDANLSKTAPSTEQPSHFRVLQGGQPVRPEDLPLQRAARGEIVRSEELALDFDGGTKLHSLVSAHPLYDAQGRSS